ncbi:MAG: hypothetical protein WCI76_01510 [bacterium]
MKKVFNYFCLAIILGTFIFIGVVGYITIFHLENIYQQDFVDKTEVILPKIAFQKITGDYMNIIVMKHNSTGEYSGQINDGKDVQNFAGYVGFRGAIKGGGDTIISEIRVRKTENFNITMNQKGEYSLIVQITK